MDYAAPLFNELVFSLATSSCSASTRTSRARASGSACSSPRSTGCTSHLLFLATNGMDIGAVSMMLYGWRDREEVLRLLEMITGLRMNHNYIRPGGVAADLPDGWRDAVLTFSTPSPASLDEYDVLLTGQPIWRERLQGVGVITAAGGDRARRHRSDPALHRCRRGTCAATCPTSSTTQVDFDVVVGSYGDCFDRYAIRLNEIRESIKIIRQILDLHARRATTGSRTRRSRRRRALASTSRWRP